MLPPEDEMDDVLLEQVLDILENHQHTELFLWYFSDLDVPEVDNNRLKKEIRGERS